MDMKVINYLMLAICSPVLLGIIILIIRLSGKGKASQSGKERRKNPKLRSLINIVMALLIILAVIAAAALVIFIYTGYILAKG